MLIKDIQDIKDLLEKVLKKIKPEKVFTDEITNTVNNINVSKEKVKSITIEELPIKVILYYNEDTKIYSIHIQYINNEGKTVSVNTSTENEEINNALKDIQEKFMEKCKKIK